MKVAFNNTWKTGRMAFVPMAVVYLSPLFGDKRHCISLTFIVWSIRVEWGKA